MVLFVKKVFYITIVSLAICCLTCITCYAETVSYDASAEGSSVTVTLSSNDDNGYDLTVSGTGRMKDYDWMAPDELFGKSISSVIVEEGVTYIGNNFLNSFNLGSMSTLTSVMFPESLVEIGEGAFRGCGGLTSVVIPGNVQKIGKEAFMLDDLSDNRTITINGLDVDFDKTSFGFEFPPFEEHRLTFNIYAGGLTEQNTIPYTEEDMFGNPYPAIINRMDAFRYDENDSTKVIEFLASFTTVIMPDTAKIISSDAFQNDNGKAIVSLDLNKVEKVENEAFKGISTLKAIYAYNSALGQDGALGDGAFAGLSQDLIVYYKGEAVKTAFGEFGITNFVELKPFKTTAAKDVSKTIEVGTEEELDLDGMFDTLYDTTLTETYSLEKNGEVISTGDCVGHKYLFEDTGVGDYRLTFKAKDDAGVESEDVLQMSYKVINNNAPELVASSNHRIVHAIVKNQYEINLADVFQDTDEDDTLTYYYKRSLNSEGMKTPQYSYWDEETYSYQLVEAGSAISKMTVDGYSPVSISPERHPNQQINAISKVEQIYFYAVDRFGKQSDYYVVTVIPHSCSIEVTSDNSDDLKGVSIKMFKIIDGSDDIEIDPVQIIDGVKYYDLGDLESFKYIISKKGYKTVTKEFIQNGQESGATYRQNQGWMNGRGLSYVVALESDPDYYSAAAVDALIDAIGEVEFTDESKAAIKAARDAYDGLNDVAKSLVEKYDKLMVAEKTIEVLQKEEDLISAQNDLQSAKEKLNKALGNDTPEEDINNLIGQVEQAKADLADAQNNLMSALEKLNEALNNEVSVDDIDKLIGQINHIKAELINAQKELELANKDKQASADEITALKGKLAALELTVKGFKVTSKGRKFTVKWKKNSKADGYRVQYKLSGAKKFKTLKTLTKTRTVTKKLKRGKKYEFRVATYKKVNGKKVFGKWTEAKIVKCK